MCVIVLEMNREGVGALGRGLMRAVSAKERVFLEHCGWSSRAGEKYQFPRTGE